MAALPQEARERGPAPAAAGVVFPTKEDDGNHHLSCLSLLAFAFLTFNTFLAISRSIRDIWAVSFASVTYVDLLALFWCLGKFARADESNKAKLKVAVWILATVLTSMFSYKVAAIMPLPVAVAVWAMGSAMAIGGFYALFLFRQRVDDPTEEEKDLMKASLVHSTAAARN